MKRKTIGNWLMVLGGGLLVAALLLFSYNQYEAARAERSANAALANVQSEIAERISVAVRTEHTIPYEGVGGMREVEIDGYGYIGYLTIPSLKLALPVMSEWDYERLRIAPCRQFGSTKNDDLVIAGHNYKMHFGMLRTLDIGAVMQFVDMDGNVNYYKVGEVNVISPSAVEKVKESGWDIALYTCTYGGEKRVFVGGARITREEAIEITSQNR